jgi:uncharacterized phage protein (TIGR01671 family)
MKREIKFRTWDDGVMLYSDAYVNEMNYSEWDYLRFFFKNIRTDAVVMQYTGLKDKNGKEIYEGDILHYQGITSGGEKIIREVSFCERRSQFMFGFYPLYDFSIAPRVIVGNIYENPDLLK